MKIPIGSWDLKGQGAEVKGGGEEGGTRCRDIKSLQKGILKSGFNNQTITKLSRSFVTKIRKHSRDVLIGCKLNCIRRGC